VIFNNAQYQILKIGSRMMNLPAASAGRFLGMDITEPEVDFIGLARSLSVAAVRVTEPDELAERVAKSLAGDTPQLIEVPIAREVQERLTYG
jgi:benzoylformate decarboxylase